MNCIFCKIVSGEMPGVVLLRNDHVCAFRDVNPVTPSHVLIVPNKHMASIESLSPEEADLAGQLLLAVKDITHMEGISKSGYRLIVNTGADGHQEVQHLHIHVLGGAPMQHRLG
jgi:histidine triad (HIT) family protein